MAWALERHKAGYVRGVPITIKPFDWTASPLRKLKILPHKGKLVGRLEKPEYGVYGCRNLTASDLIRRRRCNTRGDYCDKSFDEIRAYFQSADAELDSIESLRNLFASTEPQTFACTVVNSSMDLVTLHINVHTHSGNVGLGDIYYSFSENTH